jgi:DNA repair exonuclease SbcCD ATPase subunit
VTAVRVVLGGAVTPNVLTDGESEGHVRLTTDDGETHEISLRAAADDVVREGDPYLAESPTRVCADLFAFLDERNEVRRAVRTGADLTPLLTRPLDAEDLEAQVADLRDERRQAERELERTADVPAELAVARRRVETLEAELAEKREELADVDTGEAADPPDEDTRETLDAARTSHERTRQRIERQERQIESIESELAEKEAELDDLTVPEDPDVQAELEENRDRLADLDAEIDTLQTLYNATEQVRDRDHLDLVADVDRRLSGDAVTCWICGTETSREAIESRLADLREAVAEKRERAADLRETVKKLEERRRQLERDRSRRDELQREVSALRSRLAEREDDLTASRERREELAARIEALEAQVDETDERRQTLEAAVVRTETKLERAREEVEELSRRADQREAIEERIEDLSAEIESLRARREETIDEARAAFDDALGDVVEHFGPSFRGARLDKHTDPDTGRTEKLELVIARDGREISVDRLSEGEVELVGFVAALAGYEAFDVADRVPCLLLDDLGGLDSDHLHTLVDYLDDRTEYLVTTAYPEAGDFDGHTLSPAEWTVVSDAEESPA